MPVYPEIWAGPARSYRRDSDGDPIQSRKKYVVIHNTSNDATAEGEAAYAKVRTDGTSSHYYCDSDSILQSLNTDWCAGHVGSFEGNTYGIAYEITGVNAWTRETWLANVAWRKLAKQIAVDCREFGIPPRLLSIAEMRGGVAKGVVTHDMCRIAWGGTTHTDPGPGFPMDHLLAMVGRALAGQQTIGDNTMLIKVKDQPEVYISDGFKRRHLTSYDALVGAEAAGYQLIQVSTVADLDALAGPLAADPESLPVELDAEQLAKLGDDVTEGVLAGMPQAATKAEVRDAVADGLEGGAAGVRAEP